MSDSRTNIVNLPKYTSTKGVILPIAVQQQPKNKAVG